MSTRLISQEMWKGALLRETKGQSMKNFELGDNQSQKITEVYQNRLFKNYTINVKGEKK